MIFAQTRTWLVLHVVYRFKFWLNVGLCGIFQSLSSSLLSPALHYPANADSMPHLMAENQSFQTNVHSKSNQFKTKQTRIYIKKRLLVERKNKVTILRAYQATLQ